MKDENYLARLLNDELTEAEKKDITEADLKLFEAIKEHSAQLETQQRDASGMLLTILSAPKKKRVLQLSTLKYVAVAASLLLFFAIGYVLLNNGQVKEYAEKGTQKNLVLPDGSKVMLNADSEIAYNAKDWDDNRSLTLKGEAYFKVTKGSKFSVETPNGTITVLGTQFNVKERNNKLYVACYEGRVSVSHNGREQILTPGKSVIVVNNGWINSTVTANQPEWTLKQIYFERALLPEVIAEIERRYNIKIDSGNTLGNNQYTGTVPADNLEAALAILGKSFNVTFKKQQDGAYQLNR